MKSERCGVNGCDGTQPQHEIVCVEKASNGSQRFRISVHLHERFGDKWWGTASC